MSFYTDRLEEQSGQATVEAAYLIPIVFVLLLLLIQPTILLYNRMVMQAAASEGCRLLATDTSCVGATEEKCEGYIIRRLGSIPPQENFHIHEGGCSWEIELIGNETSERVEVAITNRVKLLPLFDMAGTLFRLYDGSGSYVQEVRVSMPTQPEWVVSSEFGLSPSEWVEKWSS